MDDNTTPEDMNDEHTHDDPQDEILDATDEFPAVDETADEVVDAAEETLDETTEIEGDDLLAAAAALDDPEDAVDAAPQPESVWSEDAPSEGATSEGVAADEPPVAEPAGTIPPPPPYPSETDRLVRDPNATLGGVASGIAHRYGFDVALTRLAFLLLILFSGGTAILAYLLAWIIIPRATYWPPTPRYRSSRFSSRELGIGLVGLGALVGLAIGGGAAGSVLVPLALVGGGVWLLTQEPRVVPAAAAMAPAGGGVMAPPPPPPAAPTVPPAGGAPVPPPAPVPPRSRGRRFVKFGLIGGVFLALLAIIAIPIIIIVALANSDFDVTTDREVLSVPGTVADIPSLIQEDEATIVLDLRELEVSDFEDVSTPIDVRIDLDFGVVEVIVPENLRVEVDAEALAGDVDVFDSSTDGLFTERIVNVDDPHLDLTIDLKAGEIDVRRG